MHGHWPTLHGYLHRAVSSPALEGPPVNALSSILLAHTGKPRSEVSFAVKSVAISIAFLEVVYVGLCCYLGSLSSVP